MGTPAHPWRMGVNAPLAFALAVVAVAVWKVSSSKGQPDEGGEESLPDPPPESSSSSPSLRRRLGASAGQAPLKGASGGAKAENGYSGTNERVAEHGNCKSRAMVALGGCRDKGAHRRDLGCDARRMGDEKRINGRPGGSGTANGCDGSAAHGSSKQSEDNTRLTYVSGSSTSTATERKASEAAGGAEGVEGRRGAMVKTHSSAALHGGRRAIHSNSYRRITKGKEATAGAGSRSSAAGESASAPPTETPHDGKPEGPAPPTADKGTTAVSLVTLRRMCRLPGVVLQSGLVFQRITSVALPSQGIGDGDFPLNVGRLAGMLRTVDLSRNRLTEFPPGLLQLGGTLEELNLGNNQIGELPPEIAALKGLMFLNLAGNRLTRLPTEIGQLTNMKRLGLKGNALVRLPPSLGDLTNLVELYITGNILEALPEEIVKLRRLRKLQLSFNNLRSLPPGMEALRSLELCRLAVNPGLAVVPEGLLFAERLSWISLAGSAWCARVTAKRRRSFPVIPRGEVSLAEELGSGASGVVYGGVYQGRQVAVKVFKGNDGPDGMAHDELDVASVVDHPNVTKVIGVVRESDQQWLVMERAPGKPLADKPDFSSVLRCRWGPGKRFEPVLVLAVLLQVARAMSYLHDRGICHGDLYAHNVLVDEVTGSAVLCDFGASFFYPLERPEQNGMALEATEVRAFGIMANDMARRSEGCEWIRQDLVPACKQADGGLRPSFNEIVNQLHAELMQSMEPSSPMVTSAKSLHSLLDRPDLAAERVRLQGEEGGKLKATGTGSYADADASAPMGANAEEGREVSSKHKHKYSNAGVAGSAREDEKDMFGRAEGLQQGGGAAGAAGATGNGVVRGSGKTRRLGGVMEGSAVDEGGEEGHVDKVGPDPKSKEVTSSGRGAEGENAPPAAVGE